MKLTELINTIKTIKFRSRWSKAIQEDAIDLLASIADYDELKINVIDFNINDLPRLLNGAPNWDSYSHGGGSLVSNYDIAKHYCTPSEFKIKKEGLLPPSKNKDWMDVQARALHQAELLIKKTLRANQ